MKNIVGVAFLCLLLAGCGGGTTGTITAKQNSAIPFDQLEFVADRTDGIAGIGITGYSGIGGSLVIQREINRIPIRFIGNEAFRAKKVFGVTIPNTVTSIGDSAFRGNLLTRLTIPNSVTSIGDSAFRSNLLSSVIIPNSVTSIGDNAFWANLLTTVTIPNGVTSIGGNTFRGNLLTSVIIPNGVTSIGNNAFSDNLLTSVTIGPNVDLWPDGDRDIQFPPGFSTAYKGVAGTYTRLDANSTTWTKQ